MATRKNLKKTGKKRIKPKGGAKKRKTVRGGVFSFLKSAKVHPKPINELTVEEWFSTISTVFDGLKKALKQKPPNQKLTEMYYTEFLNLHKIFKNEEFVRNLKNFLLNLNNEEDLEAKLKILSEVDFIDDDYKEKIRSEFKEKIRKKNNNEFMSNLNLVRGKDTNKQRSETLSLPELQGMIQSYGIQYSPKDLFNFLKSIKITEITELTESQKSTMFSFKTYFESNTEEINKFLESKPEEEKSEYKSLLLQFNFITE
jgi:hypothetical protein